MLAKLADRRRIAGGDVDGPLDLDTAWPRSGPNIASIFAALRAALAASSRGYA